MVIRWNGGYIVLTESEVDALDEIRINGNILMLSFVFWDTPPATIDLFIDKVEEGFAPATVASTVSSGQSVAKTTLSITVKAAE